MQQETLFILSLLTATKTSNAPLARNVALKKRSSYCGWPLTKDKLVDGVTRYSEGLVVQFECSSSAYADVYWDTPLFIYHVVVYEGQGDSTQLNFFTVELFHGESMRPCSSYAFETPDVNEYLGLSVNCVTRNRDNSVRIRSRFSRSLVLTEIEAYYLADDQSYFVGCVSDFRGDSQFEVGRRGCSERCPGDSFVFAVKNNSVCSCGSNYLAENVVQMQECSIFDSKMASMGGPSAYSLYIPNIRFPIFIGCYAAKKTDNPIRTNLSGSMTITSCILACDRNLYAILMRGNDCACWNGDYGDIAITPKKHPRHCNFRCSADETTTCGGNNTLSIYRTCFDPITGAPSCQQLFRCSTNWDEAGVCRGRCLPGFSGRHCLDLELRKSCSEGDPCKGLPNTRCVEFEGEIQCSCLVGWQENSKGLCEEIEPGLSGIIMLVIVAAVPTYALLILILYTRCMEQHWPRSKYGGVMIYPEDRRTEMESSKSSKGSSIFSIA